MTNRDWQRVSQALGVVLVLLIVSAIAIAAFRSTGSPAATSPAGIGVASLPPVPSAAETDSADATSGSPIASPTSQPTRSASATPVETPAGSPSPVQSQPAPSPTPTPTRTPSPTAPLQGITIQNIGLDNPALTTSTARTMRFASDGPGTVTLQLVASTAGQVRICLELAGQPQRCARAGSGGELRRTVSGAGRRQWAASVMNTTPNQAPSVRLKISFRSAAPRITLGGFPFLGTGNIGYNGIDVRFAVEAGPLDVTGTWPGNPRPWSTALFDQASGEKIDGATGRGNQASLHRAVDKGSVHVTIENTEEFVSDALVVMQAVIAWR